MPQLSQLVHSVEESSIALEGAKARHKQALHAAYRPLELLWNEYCNLFTPLSDRALELGVKTADHLPDEFGTWGNTGLVDISCDADTGLACITTLDCFRGESDRPQVYLPRKYLGDDGMAQMQADAARLDQELGTLEKERQTLAKEQREAAERAEFTRLSAKFGAAATS